MKYIDADKKSVKEMMDSLNEKIAKATKSWKGVDVDEFMDEMRGREPEVDLEKEIEKMWNVFIETEAGRGAFSNIARHFYELGQQNKYQQDRAEFAKLKAKEWQDGYDDGYQRGLNARKEE